MINQNKKRGMKGMTQPILSARQENKTTASATETSTSKSLNLSFTSSDKHLDKQIRLKVLKVDDDSKGAGNCSTLVLTPPKNSFK